MESWTVERASGAEARQFFQGPDARIGLPRQTPKSIRRNDKLIGVDKTMTEPWRELYQYWRGKHVGGRLSSRDSLDPPLELPHLAHNLMLPLDRFGDGVPKILGGMFVTGTFPPGTEIEALELVPVID